MQQPETPGAKGSSLVPLLLAFLVLSVAVAVLSFLTLGFAGFILGVAFAIAAFVTGQYLLWGWWLGPLIHQLHQREAAREADEGGASKDTE